MAEETAFEVVREKYPLKDVAMDVKVLRSGKELVYTGVHWNIRKFSKLTEGVKFVSDLHSTHIQRWEWSLGLIKKKKMLKIEIYTKAKPSGKVTCFVAYSKGKKSIPFKESRTDNRLDFQIPLTAIQVDENETLAEKDLLRLQFRFDEHRERDIALRRVADWTKRSKEFENKLLMFDNTMFKPDYLLHIGGKGFEIWKAYLAARSRFFYHRLEENKDEKHYEVGTTLKILDDLINFIYYGRVEKPRRLQDLISLYKLVVLLKIPSLQSLCETVLIDSLNKKHAAEIMQAGIDCKVEWLEIAAKNLLD